MKPMGKKKIYLGKPFWGDVELLSETGVLLTFRLVTSKFFETRPRLMPSVLVLPFYIHTLPGSWGYAPFAMFYHPFELTGSALFKSWDTTLSIKWMPQDPHPLGLA